MDSKTTDAILAFAATANPLIGLAAGLIKTYRDMRKAAQEANPALPDGTFKTDVEIINQFAEDAGLLKMEASELEAWAKSLIPQS